MVIVMIEKTTVNVAVMMFQARTAVGKSPVMKIIVTTPAREAEMLIAKEAMMMKAKSVQTEVTVYIATVAVTVVETVVMRVITVVSNQYSSQKVVKN